MNDTTRFRIDLSKVIYIVLMIVTIMLCSCKKETVVANQKSLQLSSLDELLNNDFYCYRAQYPDSNTYHFNVPTNNEFLTAFNSPPSEFDLNDDQHVNTLDRAIRITHMPLVRFVSSLMGRSQHKNRATAMKMLQARLYELKQEEQKRELDDHSGVKNDNSWGSQIRSYVLHPNKMIKDLRTTY